MMRQQKTLCAGAAAQAMVVAVCSTWLAMVGAAAAPPGLKDCPTTNVTKGHSTCLWNETCCTEQYFGAPGCQVMQSSGATRCCAPGPALLVSTTLPNILVIGDSVSDQYTPHVAGLMNDTALVQHAPWVGGGSANNAYNGMSNLQECRWLRTALRPDQHVVWDIIMFNFGLHDLPKADPRAPQQLALYTAQMDNITKILLASGAKKILYALTTPFQADTLPSCGPYCSPGPLNTSADSTGTGLVDSVDSGAGVDTPYPQPKNGGNGRCGPPMCKKGSLGCGVPNATAKGPNPVDPEGCGPPTNAVAVLNKAASSVMGKHGVDMLDLNAVVHAHCDPQTPPGQQGYSNCTLCDDETKYMGIRCGYHYSSIGIPILANAIATRFSQILLGAR